MEVLGCVGAVADDDDPVSAEKCCPHRHAHVCMVTIIAQLDLFVKTNF
jgi:hypothetical protein